MARVLSTKDVVSGHIPDSQAFARVLELVQIRLSIAAGIKSVVVMGSFHRGDSNCLSDLDIVITYYREARDSTLGALAELCRDALEQAVKIEFVPLATQFAIIGAHTWTPSFTSHVKWAEEHGGLLCGPAITEVIKPKKVGASEGLDYAVIKLSQVSKKITVIHAMDEVELNSFLSEVIQVPMFLARKVLWDKGIQLALDSKVDVVENYRHIASPHEVDLFNILVSTAISYRTLVESKPKRQFYVSRRKEFLQNHGLYALLSFLEETIYGYHRGM